MAEVSLLSFMAVILTCLLYKISEEIPIDTHRLKLCTSLQLFKNSLVPTCPIIPRPPPQEQGYSYCMLPFLMNVPFLFPCWYHLTAPSTGTFQPQDLIVTVGQYAPHEKHLYRGIPSPMT